MMLGKARLHLVALIAAIAFLLLWPGQQAGAQNPGPPFWPDVHVELDGYWVGNEETVHINSQLHADGYMFDAWVQFIPPDWFVAADADIPDGAYVGNTWENFSVGFDNSPCHHGLGFGYHWQDATTNTANNFTYNPATDPPITSPSWIGYEIMPSGLERAVEQYPNFLNVMGFPDPYARYYSHNSWGDTEIVAQLLVFERGTNLSGVGLPSFDWDLGYPSLIVFQDPTAPPSPSEVTDVCTDWSRGDDFQPWSNDNPDTFTNENGYLLRQNPGDWGNYNFNTFARGRPDADGDGIENHLDTCPFDENWDENPRHGNGPDGDGLDSACDEHPEDYNGDEDGDGYLNRGDNCPLAENGCSDPGCGPIWDAGWDNQLDTDGDGIGDVCDTLGNGPGVVDGALPDWWSDFWVEVSGDSDHDGWSDALEDIAGSHSGSNMSTPEGLWRTPWTCSDDLDNDLDGLVDGYDLGCDSDGDGVSNMFDACPEEQEDWDGFEDEDGCPDDDNDMDGVWDWDEDCIDLDHDGWCDIDCRNIPEDYDSYRDWDGCPDADNDDDGFPDVTDDCPGTDWTAGPDGIADNGDEPIGDNGVRIQTKEDYDGMIDTDGCHDSPGDDYDSDEFDNEVETYIGTDPIDACPDWTGTAGFCPGLDCDGHDAWPYDNNIDTWSNVLDILQYKGHLQIQYPDPGYVQRLDINADEWVNVLDILLYKGHLQIQCTNP